MRLAKILSTSLLTLLLTAVLAGTATAQSASDRVILEKNGEQFTVQDLALFYTERAGGDGFLAFLQNIVVYQEGKERGLEPSQEEIDQFISDQLSRRVYENYVEVFSQDTVDRMIESWIIQQKFDEHLREQIKEERGISVTTKEARNFFIQNKTKIDKPERVEMSIISVETESEAEQALQELKNGAEFTEVAAEYNTRPELSSVGGYLGEVQKGQLTGPIDEAAFNLEEGEYSEIVRGNRFNIIKVHQHIPEYNPSFSDVQEDVKRLLLERKLRQPLNERYNQLVKEAFGEINIETPLFQPTEDSPIQFGEESGDLSGLGSGS